MSESSRKRSSVSSSSSAAKRATKSEDVRRLPSDVKKQKIENGTLRFVERDVHVKQQYMRMFCDRCNIIGDNLNIVGDGNILYGEKNRANGLRNVKRTRADWDAVVAARAAAAAQPPPPPPPPEPVAVQATAPPPPPPPVQAQSAPVRSLMSVGTSLGTFFVSFTMPGRNAQTPAPPPKPIDAPAEVIPSAGVDPNSSDWKRCLLDLPGEPQTTTVEELKCIVCCDFRFDTIFIPCKHIICCRACARKLYNPEKPTLCPQCRTPIESSSIVF